MLQNLINVRIQKYIIFNIVKIYGPVWRLKIFRALMIVSFVQNYCNRCVIFFCFLALEINSPLIISEVILGHETDETPNFQQQSSILDAFSARNPDSKSWKEPTLRIQWKRGFRSDAWLMRDNLELGKIMFRFQTRFHLTASYDYRLAYGSIVRFSYPLFVFARCNFLFSLFSFRSFERVDLTVFFSLDWIALPFLFFPFPLLFSIEKRFFRFP